MGGELILSAQKLTVAKKGREILHSMDLAVKREEIHAIVGDHNSGKSLFADVVSGVTSYQTGELFFEGQSLRGFSPVKARRLGIATIHQNPRVFNSFDVLDNIYLSRGNGPLPSRREREAMGRRRERSLEFRCGCRSPTPYLPMQRQ